MSIHFYTGVTWVEPTELHVYVGGSWREVTEGWVYDGTTWQQFLATASAPTETPGTPTLTKGGATLYTSWSNTNTTDPIEVVYEAWSSIFGPSGQLLEYQGANTIAAGSTSDSFTPPTYGGSTQRVWFRARLRYYNAAGNGPWSAYSVWQYLDLS